MIAKLFLLMLVEPPPAMPTLVPGGAFCVKATMHFVAPGTSILEKLHSLVKYFGTNLELKLLELPLPFVAELEFGPLVLDVALALLAEFVDPNKFPTIAVAVDIRLDVLFLEESSAEKT